MRELALTVDAARRAPIIDRVIPLAPHGILEESRSDAVVLRIRGAPHRLPSVEDVAELCGDALRGIEERDVPDDWRERRLLDYKPLLVGRVCVRPSWAPVPEGLVDVVIDEGVAFGTGAHASTRGCIQLLCTVEPGGALADLGCGTGILSVTAAKLGFAPVLAVDLHETAVHETRVAAAANGVEVDVSTADLMESPPPAAATVCANLPPEAPALHKIVARGLTERTRAVIVAGFLDEDADTVLEGYGAVGLEPTRAFKEADWIAYLLER